MKKKIILEVETELKGVDLFEFLWDSIDSSKINIHNITSEEIKDWREKMNEDISICLECENKDCPLNKEDLKEKQELGIKLTADLSKGKGEIEITKEKQLTNSEGDKK